ncbi:MULTISPECIES: hypothetical protein [unclassified Streptomyces]|uniref:hypothetical protein n=1 Tax=unclassified Streptomyces TaxID=2593676 RepID=UPI002E316175|nr:hypothetical protein [Streptomyces sp. NBC_01268]
MADTASHTTRDPRGEHPCPACGQPRSVLAQRHKVLGAWVPEWEVQPCRNPRCERYEPEDAGADTGPGAGTGVGAGPGRGSGAGDDTGTGTGAGPDPGTAVGA